ncbi:MAG: HDOD domain-containing protein [Sandaracinaceae bacterium]
MRESLEMGNTLPPERDREPSLAGRMLGSYRIVTELGAGGMGTVWYAEHVRIGRRVAIKILHPELSADPEPVGRFVREARAVNAIRHPNIVDITDIGDDDDLVYLVMELLEGETLGARLERDEQLPLATTLTMVKQIALALSAAHERGVVHRDLKPENIFLCAHADYPDRVKVLDFGIAKLAGPGVFGRGTRPGLVLGTPTYMSPEQCMGDGEIDARSDQYALGVVTYEMLTGLPPFESDSFGRLVVMHSTEAPAPLMKHVPEMPVAVSDVVLRALSKRPEDRYEDVRAFTDALEEAASGKAAPAQSFSGKREMERRQSVVVGRELTKILRRRLAYGRAQLPGIPAVVSVCLQELDDPEADLGKVAALIERDPLVSSKLLRVVNSPAFGGRGRISSIRQAVSRIGIKRTRSILLELSVRQVFTSRDPRIRSIFRKLWEHCLAVGTLARGIAQHVEDGPEPDVAYLGGLLHDVGKPIVAAYLLDAERNLMEALGESWMADTVWLGIVEQFHREAGKALAKEWDLPPPVARSIEQSERFDHSEPRCLANLVCYANALVRIEGIDVGNIDYPEAHALALEGRGCFDVPEELEADLLSDLGEHVRALTSDEPSSAADKRPGPSEKTTKPSHPPPR